MKSFIISYKIYDESGKVIAAEKNTRLERGFLNIFKIVDKKLGLAVFEWLKNNL